MSDHSTSEHSIPHRQGGQPTVAYVLKGYPRISELFIASEIYRLEQLGVALRIIVIKPSEETTHHPIVDLIEAVPTYLPATSSLSGTGLPRWLRENLGSFAAPLRRVARRHPVGVCRAAGQAAAQSVRARKGRRPRAIYAKEFLLAVALVDTLDAAGDVEHLHAHFAHGCTTVTWLASIISGTSFSFTGHAKDIYRSSLNPAGLLARKLRAADFTLTCTAANVDHLHQIEPSADVQLAYHGLNAEFTKLLVDAPPFHPPCDRPRIISVGRLVPKKGFDVLVKAVAELGDVELVIAGEDGDQADVVRELVRSLDLADRVTLRGAVTQAQLVEEYRSSSMFVLACRVDDTGDRDGIPNVLVEAMAAGLPVISTKVSGIPEVVEHGRNGLLVPPEDPKALADAIRRVIDDPGLASSLRNHARSTINEHFDGDQLARELAERFSTRLAGSGVR